MTGRSEAGLTVPGRRALADKETAYPLRIQDYMLDFFRPRDAEGIAGLFRKVYGEGYPVRTYCDPVAICRGNESRRLISMVARTPDGHVVAHVGLYRSAPNPALYESGLGLVEPDHRKAGLMSELLRIAHLDAPRRFPVDGIWGEAVTHHTFVQSATLKTGVVFSALEADLMPSDAYVKEQSAGGRVASLVGFAKVRPLPPMTLFPPDDLHQAIAFFYSGLDLERRFSSEPPEPDTPANTVLASQWFDFARVVRATISNAGRDLASRVREIESQYDARALVYQFWVDLSRVGAPRAIAVLREKGYFIGGVVPLWNGGDAFLMQKTLEKPDWAAIRVCDDKGREILERVRKDWERTARTSARNQTAGSPCRGGDP